MKEEISNLEVIAPSVEEAVERGLDQLGLPRSAVQIEVIDSGNKGLFGLGGRQARVRLFFGFEPVEKPGGAPEPAGVQTEKTPASESVLDAQRAIKVANTVVSDLLERMHVRATVTTRYQTADTGNSSPSLAVEIQGKDLSVLIGRRSETLNALQYISNLIISRELGAWIMVSLDVQGFRSRRERQLRLMAHRMAEQAMHTGRRQTLEPMPPGERRIIHMELRDHPQVSTESVGEEPNRKVTIFIKE